jgi:gas vesicle protein GvpG
MGPLRGLLMLPLAPVTGLRWVTQVLTDEAERELAARQSPERALADLEAKRATGEISEEEAAAIEAELIDRLIEQHAGS